MTSMAAVSDPLYRVRYAIAEALIHLDGSLAELEPTDPEEAASSSQLFMVISGALCFLGDHKDLPEGYSTDPGFKLGFDSLVSIWSLLVKE